MYSIFLHFIFLFLAFFFLVLGVSFELFIRTGVFMRDLSIRALGRYCHVAIIQVEGQQARGIKKSLTVLSRVNIRI